MTDKAHILKEIQRTASENGGIAMGRQRFASETGIKEHDWRGRHWSKWSDALIEAGLEPNQKKPPIEEAVLLEKLAVFVTELGRFPTVSEIRMRAFSEKEFPSYSVWRKLGPMAGLPAKLLVFCSAGLQFNHVLEICNRAIKLAPIDNVLDEPVGTSQSVGYVYLLKFRSDYKIGASADPDRRYGEVATQMPYAMAKVYTIKTDDPFGVENYWHRRFEAKRLRGEWFKLSLADVRAFKRWKTIY